MAKVKNFTPSVVTRKGSVLEVLTSELRFLGDSERINQMLETFSQYAPREVHASLASEGIEEIRLCPKNGGQWITIDTATSYVGTRLREVTA